MENPLRRLSDTFGSDRIERSTNDAADKRNCLTQIDHASLTKLSEETEADSLIDGSDR